jgi:S-adenosylmethionine synthetase
VRIPTQHIALKAAKDYLRNVRNLDVDNDVIVDSRISEGSKDLVELFLRGPKIPLANDTSFGTGYAPMDELEKLVLESERMLNSPDYKKSHPEVGEDIKITGMREDNKIKLTVACAFVSRFIADLDEYISKKENLKVSLEKFAERITEKEVEVFVNTADDEKNGSVYITLSGTSAEMGDDGSVGRGNRANGLITPYRSMTLEATAGKNPVNHVGKIYSVLSFEIANQIAEECEGVEDVTVTLLSQIGKPIDEPHVASVGIIAKNFEAIKNKARYIVDAQLENILELTNKIALGKVNIF